MAWEDEVVGPDVASAGLHISERIGRDVAAHFDLEEALEASRYASHPYSSHPKEVSILILHCLGFVASMSWGRRSKIAGVCQELEWVYADCVVRSWVYLCSHCSP